MHENKVRINVKETQMSPWQNPYQFIIMMNSWWTISQLVRDVSWDDMTLWECCSQKQDCTGLVISSKPSFSFLLIFSSNRKLRVWTNCTYRFHMIEIQRIQAEVMVNLNYGKFWIPLIIQLSPIFIMICFKFFSKTIIFKIF